MPAGPAGSSLLKSWESMGDTEEARTLEGQRRAQCGQIASRVARRHLNKLSPRGFDEKFIDDLDGEVSQVELLYTGQATRREQVRGQPRKLSQVLEAVNRLAIGLRQAIILTFPPRHSARAAFGTGIRAAKVSAPYTLEVLQALRHGIETHPVDAQTTGITSADLDAVKRYLDEIPRADGSQEDAKDQKKAATAIKEALHLSIYGRMNRLRIAVGIALAKEPAALAETVAPFPNAARPKKTPAPA